MKQPVLEMVKQIADTIFYLCMQNSLLVVQVELFLEQRNTHWHVLVSTILSPPLSHNVDLYLLWKGRKKNCKKLFQPQQLSSDAHRCSKSRECVKVHDVT